MPFVRRGHAPPPASGRARVARPAVPVAPGVNRATGPGPRRCAPTRAAMPSAVEPLGARDAEPYAPDRVAGGDPADDPRIQTAGHAEPARRQPDDLQGTVTSVEARDAVLSVARAADGARDVCAVLGVAAPAAVNEQAGCAMVHTVVVVLLMRGSAPRPLVVAATVVALTGSAVMTARRSRRNRKWPGARLQPLHGLCWSTMIRGSRALVPQRGDVVRAARGASWC